jgi:urease accessory protein
MKEVHGKADQARTATATVTLTLDQRRKSRQRLRLDDGSEVALLLAWGSVLEDGERLLADDGTVIAVKAAPESLSVVRTEDPLALARAAYHLGNRHVPLEVRPGELRYLHDHVLDGMVRGLGLIVATVTEPFVPERGAYAHEHGHEHRHGHDHDHDR